MKPPAQIGTYTVDCEIGRGGMGVVYKATDSALDRLVAIKGLPEQVSNNPELMVRFEREAKTLAALNHPNIAGIHGIEEHEGSKYLVLEFVDGETLADRIARAPLGVDETLDICSQIAAGLEAAHDAGFIHRDLKPANAMISYTGEAKVLDFGLVRIDPAIKHSSSSPEEPTIELSDTGTKAGTILGTVRYMSPEQARGEAADRRADLWALGVVIYECLTGINPFARETPAETLAVILGEEPDLTALPETTPVEVVNLVGRCLRKDARRRQRSAGDFRLILEDARESTSYEGPAAAAVATITDRRFRIGDELCRTLDRSGFDALLPGWEMRFADNNRDSDVLIVWIPSIGGDHTTSAWRDLIRLSPFRMVIVCPVGMEPEVTNRPVVSMENQFALIRALTASLQGSLRPPKTVLSGFSCGSIMALRCAAGDEAGELIDGVLAIDPDMQESDCFITRLFSGLDSSSSAEVMNGLLSISSSCATMHEWLVLHQHMIECVDKFKDDLSPLVRQGTDLSVAFDGVNNGQGSPFVGFLRDALERVRTVRCLFHDSAENRRMIGEIRMMHFDTKCLGSKFTDDALTFIPVSDHIGMLSTERLLEYLDLIADAVLGCHPSH
jgi:serine/threonine protein kinase